MERPPRPITAASVEQIAAAGHPLRRRLIDLLTLDGPSTASLLAGRTDQLVGNVSHHLRVLARAGLIEEAAELAKDKRARWWRAVPVPLSWSMADVRGDVAGETVATATDQYQLGQHVEKVRDWLAERDRYDDSWVGAAFSTEAWVRATPAELRELGARIERVIDDFKREHAGDGDGREHAFVFAHGMPATP